MKTSSKPTSKPCDSSLKKRGKVTTIPWRPPAIVTARIRNRKRASVCDMRWKPSTQGTPLVRSTGSLPVFSPFAYSMNGEKSPLHSSGESNGLPILVCVHRLSEASGHKQITPILVREPDGVCKFVHPSPAQLESSKAKALQCFRSFVFEEG